MLPRHRVRRRGRLYPVRFARAPGIPAPSPTVCAIACAVVGYFIGKYFDKKRLAAKEAEAAAEAADGAE